MTAIPGKSSFTGASLTEGGFKAALEALHDFLTEQMGSNGGRVLAHGTVRLEYSSATELLVKPWGGNRLAVKDATSWKLREVSSGGISCPNTGVHVEGVAASNLANSTAYYVYVFDDAGTLKPDFSTTGSARDTTTGVEVKSDDATRTLVGTATTDGSGQFTAAATETWLGQRPAATQAEMEAASTLQAVVTPGRMHHHPGVAKAWGKATTGGTLDASYGISSVTDVGTGRIGVSFSRAFSSAHYAAMVSIQEPLPADNTTGLRHAMVDHAGTISTTRCDLLCHDDASTPQYKDPTRWHFAFFGDLP